MHISVKNSKIILYSQENRQKLLLLFWLKYAPNRLSAGACPRPWGSLQRSIPIAGSGVGEPHDWEEEGGGREGRKKDKGENWKGYRVREGSCPIFQTFRCL